MNVKKMRKGLGMSQVALARHLNLSRQSIFLKESGRRNWTAKEIELIKKIFNYKGEK